MLGIVGNILKIRGNLDRVCGSWEGGEFFNMAAIQTIKTTLLRKLSILNLIQSRIVILIMSAC